MNVTTHLFKIDFKNDCLSGATTIVLYMNPDDLKIRYVNTKTNKCYKSWEKMALEEYKLRGLIKDKYLMYKNVIWEKINEE